MCVCPYQVGVLSLVQRCGIQERSGPRGSVWEARPTVCSRL